MRAEGRGILSIRVGRIDGWMDEWCLPAYLLLPVCLTDLVVFFPPSVHTTHAWNAWVGLVRMLSCLSCLVWCACMYGVYVWWLASACACSACMTGCMGWMDESDATHRRTDAMPDESPAMVLQSINACMCCVCRACVRIVTDTIRTVVGPISQSVSQITRRTQPITVRIHIRSDTWVCHATQSVINMLPYSHTPRRLPASLLHSGQEGVSLSHPSLARLGSYACRRFFSPLLAALLHLGNIVDSHPVVNHALQIIQALHT